MSRRIEAFPRLAAAIALGVLLAAKVALVPAIPSVLRELRLDDSLFIRSARHLAAGEWLGPYDHATLAKGPGFPLFIAGCHHTGLSVRLGQEIFVGLACLVLYFALRRLGTGRGAAGLAFTLALFSPAGFASMTNRILRENLYAGQTILLLALILALLGTRRLAPRLGLVAALGALLTWQWYTREEGPWLLPPLFVGATAFLVREAKATTWRRAALTTGFLIATVAGTWVAGTEGLRRKNEAVYGTRTTVELHDPDYVAAVGAILRAEPSRRVPYEPRTDADLEKLFAVSPSLATLRTSLLGPSFRQDGMLAPNGGRIMNMFGWLLRDAAAAAGHHRSPETARAFYRRIADEIHAACDAGKLRGGSRRSSVIPRLPLARSGDVFDATTGALTALGEIDIAPKGWAPSWPIMELSPEREASVRRTIREPEPASWRRFFVVRIALDELAKGQAAILPWLVLAGALGALMQTIRFGRARRSPLFAAQLVLAAAVLSRAAMVGYLEVAYFEFARNYLLPAYPLLPVLAVVAVVAGVQAVFGEARLRPRVAAGLGLVGLLLAVGIPALALGKALRDAPNVAAPDVAGAIDRDGRGLLIQSTAFDLRTTKGLTLEATPNETTPADYRWLTIHLLDRRVRGKKAMFVKGRVEGNREGLAFGWLGHGKDGAASSTAMIRPGADGKFEQKVWIDVERVGHIALAAPIDSEAKIFLESVRFE